MPIFPRFKTSPSVHDALDCDRGGFAATDAQRRDTAPEIFRLERMQQRNDQARAGGADGMAERTGAAVDIEFVSVNAEVALCRHRHHGERLVDLEQIDIADAP